MSWRPPNYNAYGREEAWYRSILSSHNCFCGCIDPVRHLNIIAGRLANPAPATDSIRPLPALPAPPEPQPRQAGGSEDAAGVRGEEGDGGGAYGEEDLEELFAAAAEDDM